MATAPMPANKIIPIQEAQWPTGGLVTDQTVEQRQEDRVEGQETGQVRKTGKKGTRGEGGRGRGAGRNGE